MTRDEIDNAVRALEDAGPLGLAWTEIQQAAGIATVSETGKLMDHLLLEAVLEKGGPGRWRLKVRP